MEFFLSVISQNSAKEKQTKKLVVFFNLLIKSLPIDIHNLFINQIFPLELNKLTQKELCICLFLFGDK